MYGYLLLRGANLLGDGSELLLEVLDPGIIGGMWWTWANAWIGRFMPSTRTMPYHVAVQWLCAPVPCMCCLLSFAVDIMVIYVM